MKKIWTSFLGLLLCCGLSAQQLYGTLLNEEGEKLFGATVQWENSTTGTVADEEGRFELPLQDTIANLMVSYVGYESVLISVEEGENNLEIVIGGISDLMEVEVAAQLRDNYTSVIEPMNVEVIGSGELRKAPCCNLAESFETNASVDVAYSDALTGAREIRLLGLRGIYTQMTVEKRPTISGLASPFELEYLSGSWLQGIQIAKGVGSVQHGYQGITGQINTELVKPFEGDRLFINLYGSTFKRGDANVYVNRQINSKWSMGLLLHGSSRQNDLDDNQDNFYDTSQKELLSGMFRLFYRGDLVRAQFNVHAVKDERVSGQIDHEGASGPLFSIGQNHDRVEMFGKIGYLGFKNLLTTTGLITNVAWHDLKSFYGQNRHTGQQRNAYLSWIYSSAIGSESHKWNAGVSYLYDDYNEFLNDTDLSRMESVPGIYAEYTYKHVDKEGVKAPPSILQNFSAIAGMRIDHHNLFGWLWTPRLHLKYSFSDENAFRFAIGRGYRTANAIAENIGLLASSRNIVITERLQMEDAWNMGVNFTQNFSLGGQEGSFALDAYRTWFNNQVIIDREHRKREIWLYNLDGRSYSNSLLAVLSYELIDGLDAKLAYKFTDVRMDFLHGFHDMPLIARHRGLVTLDYETPDQKWQINTSTNLVGRQRFPYNFGFPEEVIKDHEGYSPVYATVNVQLTRRFGPLELYIGAENLTGFTQENPIIDWQNPFGEHFDASLIYGPITGAMYFAGFRYGLK